MAVWAAKGKLKPGDSFIHESIIASQLPVASWYDLFAVETIANAILDRLIHTSHRVELTGESLRKKL